MRFKAPLLVAAGLVSLTLAHPVFAQFVNGIMGPPAYGPGSAASGEPAQGGAPGAPGAPAPVTGGAAVKAGAKWVVACQPEIDKICKDEVPKGSVALASCLKAHEKDLSEDCNDMFQKTYMAAEMCKGDMEKLCADAAASGGMGKCLMAHKADLSEGCRKAIVRKQIVKTTTPASDAAVPAAAKKKR